ncbi:hypothetical protein GCM10009578_053170 [Streptomyces rhizosphaericus]|uniref:Uncharacterized protein n=1 Tax=Streptomyces rhizosphaericus TaxID=114699 RepID=A0ABP4AZM7_9ACTN
MPSESFEVRTVNLSMAMVLRYVAIGRSSYQRKVVVPPPLVVSPCLPLPTTVQPSGTVAASRKVALSEGWSLAGYQAVAACGSPVALAPPSASVCQPSPTGSPE